MTQPAAARADREIAAARTRSLLRPIADGLCAAALVASTSLGLAPLIGTRIVSAKQARQLEAMDLAAILRRLAQTYSALPAYRDRGISVVHSSRYPSLNSTQRFTTEFERSRHFSWVSDLGKNDDYRITFDGVKVFERFYGRQKEVASLGNALVGAIGISNVAAAWVPTLLMPEVLSDVGLLPAIRRGSAAQQNDDGAGGHRCFVLQARDNRLEVRVWISQKDFLVRRIEHRSAGRDVVTTTDYTPQTDISLTP